MARKARCPEFIKDVWGSGPSHPYSVPFLNVRRLPFPRHPLHRCHCSLLSRHLLLQLVPLLNVDPLAPKGPETEQRFDIQTKTRATRQRSATRTESQRCLEPSPSPSPLSLGLYVPEGLIDKFLMREVGENASPADEPDVIRCPLCAEPMWLVPSSVQPAPHSSTQAPMIGT